MFFSPPGLTSATGRAKSGVGTISGEEATPVPRSRGSNAGIRAAGERNSPGAVAGAVSCFSFPDGATGEGVDVV